MLDPDRAPLPCNLYCAMLDACEEWALPVRVDRLDWHQLSREFQRRIEGGHETVTVRCEDADE